MYKNQEWKNSLLEPEVVSDAVVKQVLSGKSGSIILPKNIAAVSTLRALPSWLQTLVRNQIAFAIPSTAGI